MLIAHKKKPNIIEIYAPHINEIESFSLLKLDDSEYKLLHDATNSWETQGDIMSTTYNTSDTIDKIFRTLAIKHSKDNPYFLDVSRKYICDNNGSSVLIRDPEKHIIRIALRRDRVCAINKICICDDMREKFFKDSKTSQYFNRTGKYAISLEDLSVYTYWSKFMNSEFVKHTTKGLIKC